MSATSVWIRAITARLRTLQQWASAIWARIIDDTFSFATFLEETLPSAARFDPSICWVANALSDEHRLNIDKDGRAEAVEIVTRAGEGERLMERLRETHPDGPPHKPDFDARLHDALVEACASAWAAEVAKLGVAKPQFVRRSAGKSPDIHVAPDYWVEVKNVRTSQEGQKLDQELADRGMVIGCAQNSHTALLRQFQGKLEQASKQLSPRGGRGIVFFNLEEDLNAFAEETLEAWAVAQDVPFGITITRYRDWRRPIFSGSCDTSVGVLSEP